MIMEYKHSWTLRYLDSGQIVEARVQTQQGDETFNWNYVGKCGKL